MQKIANYLIGKRQNFCLRRTPVDFPMSFHDSIHQVSEEHWTQIQSINNNLYLSYAYLKALEESQKNLSFRYIIIYKDKKPAAIVYVQVVQIKLSDSLKDKICHPMHFGMELFNDKNSKYLVCGNIFSSGENGFAYSSALNEEEAYKTLMEGLYRLRRSEKILGEVSSIILKEFWEKSYHKLSVIQQYDYRDFQIDPNLVLKVKSTWTNMLDYTNDLNKKYRKRFKDVLKKSEAFELRELSADQIKENDVVIKTLFDAVHEKADFKFGHFDASGFYNLKLVLRNNFIFKAYFLNGEMVGFAALFMNDGILDANYVGLNYNVNAEYCLYHRMLFDFVEVAIENKCTELFYGRTASEIKSSIGAVPVNMKIFMRHTNTISNKLMKPLFKLIQPSAFELRNPFKEDTPVAV